MGVFMKEKTGQDNRILWFCLILFALVAAGSIISYRVRIGRVLQAEENTEAYEIKWDNKKYTGSYTGGFSKLKPNGEGTFVSDDGSLTYAGGWKKGNIDGTGTITYADGTWESGTFKSGKRNGICRVYSASDSYEELNYNMDVPYGSKRIVKNGMEQKSELMVNGIPLSQLKEESTLLTPEMLQTAIYGDGYISVEGKVKFVGEGDKNCYFRIESESIGMVTGSYRNYTGWKEKQAMMPSMRVGDKVRLYGYCIGVKKNNFASDYEGYKYDYLHIEPVYGENLSKSVKKLEEGSYAFHQAYPYLDYGKAVEGTIVVNNAVRTGKKYYIQASFESAESDREQYMFVYKGKVNEVFPTGMKLKVKGSYDGLFKRLRSSEWDLYNGQHSTNERVYTYQYDMYPAVYVTELK